ncbi:NAD(P)H-hydrate dehydratase [Rhizobium alvei]|uniref:Bifunctional NAD(P)H-hydrate repair enzyme n=1 Tax=Rhizobium alvei TaxID=1132659 RepID=A0ABT8YK75_9HYPH|nr:NAD(P)H-hydrate dehydratase [Rhizobium alvei]MDO6964111.1 NAD(P)H-hydrate dehydratase [Rhizobium alvei]
MLLIEPDAVAKIDSACITSGIPGFALMNVAGRAVSAAALRDYPGALRYVVLVGPGNNGGDGYVAAKALIEAGATVALFRLFDGQPTTDDAKRAAAECACPVQKLEEYVPMKGDVVIDAVFGAGLTRGLPASLIACIDKVQSAGLPVIAVDIASGVCGRTGRILAGALHADLTVTFMAPKIGQMLLPGRIHSGRLEVIDIGTPLRLLERFASSTGINHPAVWQIYSGPRAADTHKYSHGALTVFSGGASQSGAARLAAAAALRAGAGLVTIAAPTEAMAVNANHMTAIMLREVDDQNDLAQLLEDKRLQTFILGPGFGVGDKARDFALALATRRLVLDADAITSFRDRPEDLFDAFALGETRLILTPHDGEFSRLFPDLAANQALSKVERAQHAARRAHAVVILKGADTVIADPAGRATININAPPSLATAGSGDVLAGLCGAFLAQNYPAFAAACAAVWHHGDAAQRAGAGLTAERLINFIET